MDYVGLWVIEYLKRVLIAPEQALQDLDKTLHAVQDPDRALA